jgi:hypothetical protein
MSDPTKRDKYDIVKSVQEIVVYLNESMDLNYYNENGDELGKFEKFIDSNGKEFNEERRYILNNTPTKTGVVKFEKGEIAFSKNGRELSEKIYCHFREYHSSKKSPGSKSRKRSPDSRYRGGRTKRGRKTRGKK